MEHDKVVDDIDAKVKLGYWLPSHYRSKLNYYSCSICYGVHANLISRMVEIGPSVSQRGFRFILSYRHWILMCQLVKMHIYQDAIALVGTSLILLPTERLHV